MNYFVRSKHYRINDYGLTIRQKLFVEYLAHRMHWTKSHLLNFIHKYYGKTDITELTKKEAIAAIESLKNISKHQNTGKDAGAQ
jgi:hypothetical protein